VTTNKTRLVFLIFVLIGLIFSYIGVFNLNKPQNKLLPDNNLLTDKVNRFAQTYWLNKIDEAQNRLLRSDVQTNEWGFDSGVWDTFRTFNEWDCNQKDFNREELEDYLTNSFIFNQNGSPVFDEINFKKNYFRSILITPDGNQTKLIDDELFGGGLIGGGALKLNGDYYYSITPNNLNPDSAYTICAKSDIHSTFYCLNDGESSIVSLDKDKNKLRRNSELTVVKNDYLNFINDELLIIAIIILLAIIIKMRFVKQSIITSVVNLRPSMQFKKIATHMVTSQKLSKYWRHNDNLKQTKRILVIFLIWFTFLLGGAVYIENQRDNIDIERDELVEIEERESELFYKDLRRIYLLKFLYTIDSEKQQDSLFTEILSPSLDDYILSEDLIDPANFRQELANTQWKLNDSEGKKILTNNEIEFLEDVENIILNDQWLTYLQQFEIRRIRQDLANKYEESYNLNQSPINKLSETRRTLNKLQDIVIVITLVSLLLFFVVTQRWLYHSSIQGIQKKSRVIVKDTRILGAIILSLFIANLYTQFEQDRISNNLVYVYAIENLQNSIKDHPDPAPDLLINSSIQQFHLDINTNKQSFSEDDFRFLQEIADTFSQYELITTDQLKKANLILKSHREKFIKKRDIYETIQVNIILSIIAGIILFTFFLFTRWQISHRKKELDFSPLPLRWGLVFLASATIFFGIWKFIEFESLNRLFFLNTNFEVRHSAIISKKALLQIENKKKIIKL